MQIISKKDLESERVSISGQRVFTNSLVYSSKFGFNHADTLAKIRNLTMEYSIIKSQFSESTFINERNREFPYFKMNRDGYMTLVMQMGGAKNKKSKALVFEQQQLFIQGFNRMEQVLLNQKSPDTINARNQSKIARKEETDAIKQFVEYAIEQGSQNAKRYYSHFTKYTYKALSLIEHNKPKTRDTLDMMELNQLVLAEYIVTKVIKKAMDDNIHYKDVYPLAQNALDKFADSLYLKEIK